MTLEMITKLLNGPSMHRIGVEIRSLNVGSIDERRDEIEGIL